MSHLIFMINKTSKSMADHGSGAFNKHINIPELYMFNRTVSRDQSITFHLISGNSFFWPIMLKSLLKISTFCSKFSYHPTVKNIGGERTLANYCISLSFLLIFIISITFPMQMNFNLQKFFPPNFLQLTSLFAKLLPPKFFTVQHIASYLIVARYIAKLYTSTT